ncbi:MAG TPA: hypothetical protein VM489_03560, partial [Burkholderiales bacterium]|nr:hypothetical protein [Burkholderiales bacterium]
MDERAYVVEALLERLRSDGVAHRLLGEEDVTLAVAPDAFGGMPRHVARFCQDFDLKLVQLARVEPQRWEFVLAWTDERGRPRFLGVQALGDYFRARRRLLRGRDLLAGTPSALFAYTLLEALERQSLGEARGERLAELWHRDPRGAIERLGRLWRARRDLRLVARAAKRGDWTPVRAELAALRRALHRSVAPTPGSLAATLRVALENRLAARSVRVAFIGGADPALRSRIAQDLAPAFPGGLGLVEPE